MGLFQSKEDTNRLLAEPTMPCTLRVPLFNGLLYRLVDEGDSTIGFFNNSKDYEFHVTYLFNANSVIEPLDKATAAEQDDGILCEVSIYPLETQRFVKGEISGYESKIDALLLSDDYFRLNSKHNPEKYFRRVGPFKSSAF